MNEQIAKLISQAQKEVWGNNSYNGSPEFEGYELDVEKLVELIVRECMKEMGVSKQCDPYTGEVYVSDYNRAIDDQISMLIDYFGVEEGSL